MNTEIHSKPPTNQIPDTNETVGHRISDATSETYQTLSARVGEGVERTKELAQQAVDATKDAAHRASDSAKDLYNSASAKAEEVMVSSKEYAHQHPFPVALGTLIAGLTIGYLIGLAQREELTFRQRLFR